MHITKDLSYLHWFFATPNMCKLIICQVECNNAYCIFYTPLVFYFSFTLGLALKGGASLDSSTMYQHSVEANPSPVGASKY